MPRSTPSATLPKRKNALRLMLALTSVSFLAACASNIGDSMPASIGGLPAEAPERPAEAPAYPAIHATPPPRAAKVLDEDQQEKLEKDLAAARERQEGRAPKPKKPKSESSGKSTGAKPNP